MTHTPLLALKAVTAVLVVVFLLCMASCRSATMSPLQCAEGAMFPALPATSGANDSVLSPFGSLDHVQFTSVTASRMLAESRAVTGGKIPEKKLLTLQDCRSIALKNNLDLQIARVEEFTKQALKDRDLARSLPHFSFSSEFSQRDNPSYSYADVLGDEGITPSPESGTGVTNYSMSHERSTWRYSFETRWSPVDAVLACYLSRNTLNDSFKAHHQKVRVAQKLIGTVDAAYFRLLALQDSLAHAKQLVATRNQIAGWMRRLQKNMVIRLEDYDRVEQKAIEARRVLAKIGNEMERQRNILVSAMGLPPEYCAEGSFCVAGKMCRPKFDIPACDMEMIAIKNRPEAYQAGLDHLSSVNDVKRIIIKYLPKVEGFWRFTRDKDKFLYNKDWKDVGFLVHFDLLDWLSTRHESKAAKSVAEKTYTELGAVALAISSQVRVAGLTYEDALDDYQTREASLVGTQKVLETARIRMSSDDLSQLELEEAEGNLLYQKLQRIRALGEANATLAELQTALGTNYPPSGSCN
jgi:outer membrane protein TolC